MTDEILKLMEDTRRKSINEWILCIGIDLSQHDIFSVHSKVKEIIWKFKKKSVK